MSPMSKNAMLGVAKNSEYQTRNKVECVNQDITKMNKLRKTSTEVLCVARVKQRIADQLL